MPSFMDRLRRITPKVQGEIDAENTQRRSQQEQAENLQGELGTQQDLEKSQRENQPLRLEALQLATSPELYEALLLLFKPKHRDIKRLLHYLEGLYDNQGSFAFMIGTKKSPYSLEWGDGGINFKADYTYTISFKEDDGYGQETMGEVLTFSTLDSFLDHLAEQVLRQE